MATKPKESKANEKVAPLAAEPPVKIKNVYKFKEGDKLSEIATANGISLGKLAKLNNLVNYEAKPGQELVIK